ncbi:unnamed protein product [Owenia fusiformis]|uniref:VWFA domain-containing protein n=1 Tax=Owenia fusiformis TaxID=6347 RepID=A0A8S4PT57_OWEFU|nr:unnamed protein product [Owenia fusiformis]
MKNMIPICALMCVIVMVHADKEVKIKEESEFFSEPGKNISSRCHQKNEQYILEELPPFGAEELVCDYYRCVNTRYQKTKCPPGRAVGKKYLEMANHGIATSLFPCSQQTKACGGLSDVSFRPDLRFCGFDLIWVVDMSCSIADEDKAKVVDFINKVISKFHIGPMHVLTGGLSYASETNDIQTLKEGRNKPITLRNFAKMEQKDGKCRTRTDLALKQVRDHYFTKAAGDRPDYQNVMVFISDGMTYISKQDDNEAFSQEAIGYGVDIRKSGAINIVVGMPHAKKDDYVGMEEWIGISGDSSRIYLMESFEELAEKVQYMAENICRK